MLTPKYTANIQNARKANFAKLSEYRAVLGYTSQVLYS